jgi:hypothetical protein
VIFNTCAFDIIRELDLHVDKEDRDAFNLWAFGYSNFLVVDLVPLWNKRHGISFFINEDCDILSCANRMFKLWEYKV